MLRHITNERHTAQILRRAMDFKFASVSILTDTEYFNAATVHGIKYVDN